jgi:DNA-binding MarR family transcriptional regulator
MQDRPSETRRKVDKQLSFALYGAANRMARMHKPFLEPLELTFTQYLAMLELLDEAPLSVGALGTRLGMDTGTITPLLKRMQASGFVTRTRDVADERRVLVDLTPEGRALDADIRGVAGKITSACQLTDENAEDLRHTLETLAGGSAA